MFAETQRANPFKWNVEWGDLRDASVLGLIASNMVVVVWALIEKWNLAFLMSVYWAQSVIIGIFWFLHHRDIQKCLQEIYRGPI